MITRVFKILTWIHHISLIVLKYAHAHLIIHKARTTYVTLDEKNNNIINCDWCIFITFGLQYKKKTNRKYTLKVDYVYTELLFWISNKQ